MKKTLILAASCLMLIACKKNDNEKSKPDEQATKYPVTFNVQDFEQSVVPMSSAKSTMAVVGDTLKNYANNLYYRVFNSSGVMIKRIDQASTLSAFGSIKDSLTAGTYDVFIAATKGSLFVAPGVPFTQSYYNPIFTSTVKYWDDTFVKLERVTVGSAPLTKSVRLSRVVAGLDLLLTDAIPTTVSKITITCTGDMSALNLSDNTDRGSNINVKEFTINTTDQGVANKKFSMFVANTFSPISITIKAYDNSSRVITEKTVNGVTFLRNAKTTLSGALFSSVGIPGAFTINVDPTWGTGNTVAF